MTLSSGSPRHIGVMMRRETSAMASQMLFRQKWRDAASLHVLPILSAK